jgi:hypothetical protein
MQTYANLPGQLKCVSVKHNPVDYGLDRKRGDNVGELHAAWYCIDHLRKQLCAWQIYSAVVSNRYLVFNKPDSLRGHGNVSVTAKKSAYQHL